MDEDVLRKLGRDAHNEGDFDEAASYYRRLVDIQPNDYTVIAKLGSVLILQSNFNEAIKVYSEAIVTLQDRSEEGEALGNMHIRLAEAYLSLNRLENVQVQLKLAGQAGANPALLNEIQGRTYNATGEYRKALAAYEEYLNVVPDENYGYLGMATAFEGLKQYDRATQSLELAKKVTPGDYWVDIALGNLAMTLKDYHSALDYYKSAQELGAGKPAVFYSMGAAYLALEDYENARNMFSLALERLPKDADAMYGLAQVEMVEGNTRQAIALLKSAIVIDPLNHPYYTLLVQAQTTSGKVLEALRTSLKARKLFVNQRV